MIGIHAVASNRNADERMWNVGHWASLINQLDGDIVFIGTWDDRQYYNRIYGLIEDTKRIYDLCGRLTLEEVACYLYRLSCLVCVNSGIMHIAVYANIPTVAIVGGTPAFIILPERDNIKYLEDPELKWWVTDAPHAPRVSRLNEIMPEMVLEKINELG